MVNKLFVPTKDKAGQQNNNITVALRAIERWVNSNGVQEITSNDGTVTVTNPYGPVVDLHAAGGGGGGYASLTGPGQTTSPGNLTQAGGLTVNDYSAAGGMGLSFYTPNNGIVMQTGSGGAGSGAFDILQDGSGGLNISNVGSSATQISSSGNQIILTSSASGSISWGGVPAGGVLVNGSADIKLVQGPGVALPSLQGIYLWNQTGTGGITLRDNSSSGGILVYSASGVDIESFNGTTQGVITLCTSENPSSSTTQPVNLFTWSGNPNGHVSAFAAGDVCFDIGTPGIWLAHGGGTASWTMYTNP